MSQVSEKRVFTGIVTSDNRDKTISVEIVRKKKHPLYSKFVKKKTRFHVHDEENAAKCGNIVEFVESRPLSKTKFWCLKRIIN